MFAQFVFLLTTKIMLVFSCPRGYKSNASCFQLSAYMLTCLHAYVLALSCSSLVAASSSIIVFSARDCSARLSIFFTSSFAAAAPLKSFCDTSPLIIFFLALLTLIAFHWHSIELNCAEIKQPEAKDNYLESTVPRD